MTAQEAPSAIPAVDPGRTAQHTQSILPSNILAGIIMKILLLAAEVTPFSKTGGLADVSAALARQLHRRGHTVRLVTPLYPRVRDKAELGPMEQGQVTISFPDREYGASFHTAPLPGDGPGPDVIFVDCPELFDRPTIYTEAPDEPLRFALLTRAALQLQQQLGEAPDIVHCNDWHTALAPLYLRTLYAWDGLFENTRTLLTLHNIGYQGVFPADALDRIGLGESRELVWQEDLQGGRVNFLKTGLQYATGLSTVSSTYAREIQTAEYGHGLEELLERRSERLVGILNGVDYGDWDPARDPAIAQNYSAEDLSGKARCKQALCERMGLDHDPSALVFGIISRLTGQKGFELLPDSLTVMLRQTNTRLAVLGSGEEGHESFFRWMNDTMPGKVAFQHGYDEDLSHQIEAGSDAFVMPSRYEPCGLNQMYSLRYGTIPIVRRTGGLADTVVDHAAGEGTGFCFDDFSAHALLDALQRAHGVWQDQEQWQAMIQRGMAQDFSWEHQVGEYEQLYERLQQLPPV